jgi:putative ABC transport system substrate-binding protein
MHRRALIAGLAGAVALPFTTRAQQPMPVVGFLRSSSLAPFENLGAALRQGLKEAGFIEGRNVAIESRFGDNQNERLPALAAELVRRPVDVIVANSLAAQVAKRATPTIPIVFAIGFDPVSYGLVTSLNRPGGNVTGVTFLSGVLGAKRLELLRQVIPKATTIALLMNPSTETTEQSATICWPRPTPSGSRSSSSRSPANAISRRPLLTPFSAGPARCWSAPAPS